MPPRSTVYTLPESVRDALDRRIIAAGFGRYADHAGWLAGQGHVIGPAALQRYGRRLRDSVERDRAGAREAAATMTARIHRSNEMARAIDEATGDDPLALPERAVDMCLVRICEAASEEDIDARTLQAAGRLLNDCLRAAEFIRSEREEERKRALRASMGGADAGGRRRGLSPEVAAVIRQVIEGPPEDCDGPMRNEQPRADGRDESA
ncbi:MAG: DUF3486 family protein [Alphaproteobacteria bacterium]|nr:DUF3486 family protein [Alphaproteobacteria bacterium]